MSSLTSLLSSSPAPAPASGWEIAGQMLSSTATWVVRNFDQLLHIANTLM